MDRWLHKMHPELPARHFLKPSQQELKIYLAEVAINDYREFTKGEISADEYVVRKKLAFN
jgi:hypothetical protein